METSSVVGRLIPKNPGPPITNHPWNGRGQVTWTVLIFGVTNYFSGTADARVVKFYAQVGTIEC